MLMDFPQFHEHATQQFEDNQFALILRQYFIKIIIHLIMHTSLKEFRKIRKNTGRFIILFTIFCVFFQIGLTCAFFQLVRKKNFIQSIVKTCSENKLRKQTQERALCYILYVYWKRFLSYLNIESSCLFLQCLHN